MQGAGYTPPRQVPMKHHQQYQQHPMQNQWMMMPPQPPSQHHRPQNEVQLAATQSRRESEEEKRWRKWREEEQGRGDCDGDCGDGSPFPLRSVRKYRGTYVSRGWISGYIFLFHVSPSNGVEAVKVEADKNKLTVIEKVDPVKLHMKMEKSTKKKIELLSPQPKKNDSKQEKNNKNKNKQKEPPVTAAFFKINLHCDGCCERIRNIITKTKGVHTVEMDGQKDVVTVRGAVDPEVVQARLKKKMKLSA
uniref:HMA domain-containing protein n=1 Tax=Kalanchoe fedtschenkoi TaxID=63787 RepID=A0A7N0TCU8_KALFE